MPYRIKRTVKEAKTGREYVSYFKEFKGWYVELSGPDRAAEFVTKLAAKQTAKKYFREFEIEQFD